MPLIPDEWQFKAGANNPASASIVIPAGLSQVRHVLTFVDLTLLNSGGGLVGPVIEVLDGATSLWTWQLFSNAPAGSVDTQSFIDNLKFMGSPNTSMTIHFTTPTPVNGVELILVRGYSF